MVLFNFLLWPSRRKRRNPLKEMAPVVAGRAKASGGMLAGSRIIVCEAPSDSWPSETTKGYLAQRLDRAGIRMRPAEYLVLSASVATVVAMIFLLLSSLLSAISFFILVWAISWAILNSKGNKREPTVRGTAPGHAPYHGRSAARRLLAEPSRRARRE